MKLIARSFKLTLVAFACLTLVSCSSPQHVPETNSSATPSSPPKASSSVSKDTTMAADPNPIKVCDGSGVGVTTLNYSTKGPTKVELHLGSPNGTLFAQTGPTGTATTGKWVNDGLVFYLQDVSDGKSLTPDNTLGTVTVGVTTAGCN